MDDESTDKPPVSVSEETTGAPIVGAVVVSGDFERFLAWRKAASDFGLRVHYSRTAPPWMRLWVTDARPEELPPRRREGSP